VADLIFRRIGPGAVLDLAADNTPYGAIAARGRGRASAVRVPAGSLVLGFCLSGTLRVETAEGPFRLRERECLALPPCTATLHVQARDGGEWGLVALPAATAARLMRGGRLRGEDAPLFPHVTALTRPLLRALLRLQRLAGLPQQDASAPLQDLLQAAELAQRHKADAWVQRASGRSLRHRQQVVQRLLSARNRILNTPFESHDLDTLAAAARYSKSHFLRMFRNVFGSTPHDLVISARMELAKDLIAHSDLAISEVAASVGYDSRFAFARLFKKRVGMTASDYRQDGFAEMQQAA
jgi:AraC-like DNA-binding protein